MFTSVYEKIMHLSQIVRQITSTSCEIFSFPINVYKLR